MRESKLIHLSMQFFAEPEGGSDEGNAGGAAGGTESKPGSDDGQNKTPSFDDILKNKDYQKEFDRRMSKAQATALEKAKAEWEADAKKQADEAAKLAKMSEEEKAKHQREKQEKALAEREAAVAKRELTAEAISQLAAKDLPTELSACLNYENAEACKTSLEAVEKAFNAAVEKKVNDKLRGAPPKAGNGGGDKINSLADAIRARNNK